MTSNPSNKGGRMLTMAELIEQVREEEQPAAKKIPKVRGNKSNLKKSQTVSQSTSSLNVETTGGQPDLYPQKSVDEPAVASQNIPNDKTEFMVELEAYCNKYAHRVKTPGRRCIYVDNIILDTVRKMDIEGMSMSTVLNGILHACIKTHGDELKLYITERDTLL
jgi:hypothetical protein